MRYKQHVDVMRYDDLKQILQVNGWLMFQDGRKYELEARVDGKKVPCKVQWGERKDVLKLWKGDGTPRQSGYRLAVHMGEDAQSLELWVKAEGIHQDVYKRQWFWIGSTVILYWAVGFERRRENAHE